MDVSSFSPLFEHMKNDYTRSVVVRIKKNECKALHAYGPQSDSDYMKGLTWHLKDMN